MTTRKIIIAENYECTKGTIIENTYKRVQYSLTLKPDIIEVFRKVTRQETTLETTFKTLEEFLSWENELKATYKHRITRKALHYIHQKGSTFEYTDYHKPNNCGMRVSDGLIIIPQTITVPTGTKYDISVSQTAIFIVGSDDTYRKFIHDKDYQEWYQLLTHFFGKIKRKGIRYYRYLKEEGRFIEEHSSNRSNNTHPQLI